MTLYELRDWLDEKFWDIPAEHSDIPRKFRRGAPPMYYNNGMPLAWDAKNILVSRHISGLEDENGQDRWYYVII